MCVTIALFTRDLRVHDNPMLTAACREGAAVVPLFVVDEDLLKRTAAPNRMRFLGAALAELDAGLQALGGRLIVRHGEVAEVVAKVAAEAHAESVHVAADVSWYSRRRERRLRERLEHHDCLVHTHPSSITAVDRSELTPATGRDHFSVFTPYYRRWREIPLRKPLRPPHDIVVPPIASDPLPDFADSAEDSSPELQVGGEQAGRKLLRHWLSGPVEHYDTQSDELGADATSRLSPYLHFGCLSPAEIVHRADTAQPGAEAFIRQLAWRDFNHQLLCARPDAGWNDYRPRQTRWRDDPKAAAAWCAGRTGYPVVDAGLRQLRAEGWMPGRARLIAASFLVKTLGVDWRVGARHFLHWLVDADVANNQLNWQWVAGTGTDTRPNRVLNPILQAERHDPGGAYVRRWIPELAEVPAATVHRPWRAPLAAPSYPPPLVECRGM
ncbi:cryptochrome/photolyase family protein [Nocardia sp. alder85J]|uniref:cryptochrome/photolyase family protein n=1 Tax=Nocardia sp. alder85J TaxID=2862949 RepID=UPI001CD47132|nr:deoxyribodipyrimidine photo-lyase [Nocardia sp. alder85J]MCX4098165.1 deoxyribodipyrimidine photo-lyase [Nocardia sp. alder85J]